MTDHIAAIIAAAFGSSGLFAFIQFLISRRDKRKSNSDALIKRLDEISAAVEVLTLESCRVQILTLIHTAPHNAADILILARHYFVDLNGDTYVSRIFAAWLKEQEIDRPEWFNEH